MDQGNMNIKLSHIGQFKKSYKRNYQLYWLLLIPIVYFIMFRYLPMYGIVLSFRKYVPMKSAFGVEWVGFKYFKHFLSDSTFWHVFKNTFVLSSLALVIGFPLPIIFALSLNEVRGKFLKKFVQTVSYLPKFLSIIIVVLMINTLLSPSTGIINSIIVKFGGDPIHFIREISWFRTIYIVSDVWQFMGWNAILYIAALSSVDEQLYEAASLDGANRWQQTWHVTIPGIMPTIVITFILAVGQMLNTGFEKILLLYSPGIYDVADVIQTYVYRIGLEGRNFSYATAVGLFQSIVSLIFLWVTNKGAQKFSDTSLW